MRTLVDYFSCGKEPLNGVWTGHILYGVGHVVVGEVAVAALLHLRGWGIVPFGEVYGKALSIYSR